VREIWADLQQAHKFGSLVKIEEKLSIRLHGIVEQSGYTLFGQQEVEEYERFKTTFFKNLEDAVTRFASQQGNSFLTDKTQDAITFLKLLSQKYDLATANPPFTDSSDFGEELKYFIDSNYKRTLKCHVNLYATFIKRCHELIHDTGRMAMIHPYSFMFIKTFEDIRKLMIESAHIELLADWGLDRVNIFAGGYASAPAFYVLSKEKKKRKSIFFQLTTNLQEKAKKPTFEQAFKDYIDDKKNDRVYEIDQSRFKIINSWPLIYWISENFRNKFKLESFKEKCPPKSGMATANNNRFLRYWWEVDKNELSFRNSELKKWVRYSKGGEFKRWYGNLWLRLSWENNAQELRETNRAIFRNEDFYFREGITYSALGGGSFRYLPENCVYDVGGASLFPKEIKYLYYSLAILNSKLCGYIINCLNPTVNTQVGDTERVPFVDTNPKIIDIVTSLTKKNVVISKKLNEFSVIEDNYSSSPITGNKNLSLFSQIKYYLDKENFLTTQINLSEAIINEMIFEAYELTDTDRIMVLEKEGESIGSLPVSAYARQAYLENEIKEFPLDNIREFIKNLPEKEFAVAEREAIESEFPQLYQSNNDLEEFCIRHQVNPINVWYWFKLSNVIPKQRMNDLAMEFLADMLREILMKDDDGIISLVPNAGEKVLLDRIEEKFIEKGFTMAQYSSFDSVLGRELNDYINNYFFKAFSDHLNLFMYLPKTPFIWHLTSGPEQGFDCYIIIYKWSRDKLMRIRSVYIENRERALVNRQTDLRNKTLLSAAEQNEADKIYKQLKEIESFKKKIDELLEEGYNPILDDGVGKNIAPLQKKGMLPYEVLNAGQLKKYLNADW
jgi:hypothetical protein